MQPTHPSNPAPAANDNSELLQLIVESAPVAIVVVDASGKIALGNRKLSELFGYAPEDLIGQPVECLLPDRFHHDHEIYRTLYVDNPHVRPMGSGLDLSGRRQDGSEFPIEVGLSYVRLYGELLVMASVVDITRRKQTEELLERRVQERTHEIERRRQVAVSLRDILAVLNSNRPLQEILDHIVAQARDLLKADASAIYQVQDNDKPPLIEASAGLTAQQLMDAYTPAVARVLTQAANGSEPVAAAERWPPAEREPVQLGMPAYAAQLAVPLRIKNDNFAGRMLYYVEPRKFSSEEIELAVMFGDQAALAIENARLRARAERTAVDAERNRIARDLHDSVTQTLFSASLIAQVLPKLVVRDPAEGNRRLEELRELTRGALAEMRTLLLELRPATLIEVSMEELLRQLTEAARGRARIPIEVHIEGGHPLPPDVKTAFYYIAQEALNNVAKHARAQSVRVGLQSTPAGATLTVHDDGQGFEVSSVTPEHLGLAIMRERSEAISGRLHVRSDPGTGTRVQVMWANPETSITPAE